MSDSFCKRLVDSFESRPDKIAMRIVGDETEVYTFGRSLEMIRSIAYRLGQEGITFGDRVALIGENHPSWAIAYLGILYHGAVVVPMDPHGETATLANFLENSEAKLVFVGDESLEILDRIYERISRFIPTVVWQMEITPASSRQDGGGTLFSEWTSTPFPESFASEIP